MNLSTTVKLVLSESPAQPLPGVKVSLYDRDRLTADNLLGAQTTNTRGLARFQFAVPEHAAKEDLVQGLPKRASLSDLYVVVYSPTNQVVCVTHKTVTENALPDLITVSVSSELAIRHGLVKRKPRRSDQARRSSWQSYWKKHPGTDPCVARAVLDMMAGLDSPTTDLQRKLAKALDDPAYDAVKPYRKKISDTAAQGLKWLDTTVDSPKFCSSEVDPKELYKLLFSPGGSLSTLGQALNDVVPSPRDNLPASPSAGLPFPATFEWLKDCINKYQGEHDGEEPPATEYVTPPQVNLIRVFQPTGLDADGNVVGKFVREANPDAKTLLVRALDGQQGWQEHTLRLDASIDTEGCLVRKTADAETDTQIFVVDVRIAQSIELRGSGFIADSVKVLANRYAWCPPDPNDGGQLIPEDISTPIVGWNDPGNASNTLPVYGASSHALTDRAGTFRGDYILFDWPRQFMEQGLYEIWLQFENETDPPLPSSVTQTANPECKLIEDYGPVQTEALWFAVLPTAEPRRVSLHSTQVVCGDETEPESLALGLIPCFDDVLHQTMVDIRRASLDQDALELPDVLHNAPDSAGHWFWQDGDTWNLSLGLLPGDQDPHLLGFDQFLFPSMYAFEIFGEIDRLLIKAVLIVAWTALIVLLVAILAIAAVALIAGTLAALVLLEVITAGTATPLGVAIAAGVFAMLTPLVAAIVAGWTAGIAAIVLLVDRLPIGPDLILTASSVWGGEEIANRLSHYRFHRALWFMTRPERLELTMPVRVATEMQTTKIIETYTGGNPALGGTYSMRLEIDTSVV